MYIIFFYLEALNSCTDSSKRLFLKCICMRCIVSTLKRYDHKIIIKYKIKLKCLTTFDLPLALQI